MKFKFKFFVLLTIFSLFFTVVACGNGGDNVDGGNNIPNINEGDKIEVFFNDRVVEYNGEMYVLEVENLPEGVYVKYEYFLDGILVANEGVVEPGEYEVRAYFHGDVEKYGLPYELTAHLIIKGEGNSANIWFEDQIFVFDGQPHSIYLSGYIPEGIEVFYEGNEQIAPGFYEVFAYLEGDLGKYGLPEYYVAYMSIVDNGEPVEPVKFHFVDKIVTFDGSKQKIEVEFPEIGGIPEGVSIEYEYYFDGKYISNDGVVDPGVYSVRAIFKGNIGQYELPEMIEVFLIIEEVVEQIEIDFFDQIYTYDGQPHSIFISTNLPDDVSVYYVGNDQTEVGEYIVHAYLEGNFSKYGLESNYMATLIIEPIYILEIEFPSQEIYFDGKEHNLEIVGELPDDVWVEYSYINMMEPGEYNVDAWFYGEYKKYGLPECMSAILIIKHAPQFDLGQINYTYDGQPHSLCLAGIDEIYEYYVCEVDNEGNFISNQLEHTDAGTYYYKFDIYNASDFGMESSMIAEFIINKAPYSCDTSLIEFPTYEAYYTAEYHEVSPVAETIPLGLEVAYYNQQIKNVCENYTHVAHFKLTDEYAKNYYLTENIFAITTVTIKPYEVDFIFEDETILFDGSYHYIEVKYPQELIDNHPALYKELRYIYQFDYINNNQREVGDYEIIANIIGSDSNYSAPSQLTMKLSIVKGQMQEVNFYDQKYVYDGESKNIYIDKLPSDCAVKYTGNSQTEVGNYTVTATIESQYYETKVLTATLTIVKADLIVSNGNFTYNDTFTYDGTAKEVALKSTYISSVVASFKYTEQVNAGTYPVTVTLTDTNGNYNDYSYVIYMTIDKANYDMSNVTFVESSVVYDGNSKTLMVSGELPEGVSVNNYIYYSNNTIVSEAINVGTYNVVVLFLGDSNHNEIPSMISTLKITPADYDMSNIKFPYYIATYDGNDHTSAVEGELPEGVEVSYQYYQNDSLVSEVKNAGEYKIVATFTHSNNNYKKINDIEGKMVINKAEINPVFVENEFTYDGINKSIYIAEDSIPSCITVKYDNNSQSDAGTHTVVASFFDSTGNYNVDITVEGKLVIKKADLNVTLEDEEFSYDGKTHDLSLKLNGNTYFTLPSGITYTSSDYGRYSAAGVYTFTFTFSGENLNYNTPEPLSATLSIVKDGKYHDIEFYYVHLDEVVYVETYYAFKDGCVITDFTFPELPLFEHYEYTWDYDGSEVYSDLKVYAYSTKIVYTIFLNTDGAYLNVSHIDLTYGDEFVLPVPTKAGFTFDGWYYGNHLVTSKEFTYETDITLKAKWSHGEYFLRIYNMNNVILYEEAINYYVDITLPTTLIVDDHTATVCYYQERGSYNVYFPNETFRPNELKNLDLFVKFIDERFSFQLEDDNTLAIKSYNFNTIETQLEIPVYGYYEGKIYKITKLLSGSIFSDDVKVLEIPSSITTIDQGALLLPNLVEITIPFVGNKIDDYYVSESGLNTNFGCIFGASSVSENATYVPSSLTTVVVRDALVDNASLGCFTNCSNISDVIIGSNYYSIPTKAFSGCSSLNSIELSDGLYSIDQNCFDGCSLLETIVIPDSVYNIGSGCFRNCAALSKVQLPKNLRVVPESMFANCTSLVDITIPEGVTSVYCTAFGGTSIVTLKLPKTVEYLSGGSIKSLENLYLYPNVTISGTPFPSTFNHDVTIYFYGDVSDWLNLDFSLSSNGLLKKGSNNSGEVFLVLDADTNQIPFDGNLVIPEGVTTVKERLFDGFVSLKSITFPSSVTTIEEYAFYECQNLVSVTFPADSKLSYIGEYAFANTNLTSFTLPTNITEIPNGLFYGCDLTSLPLTSNITKIGDYAFAYNDFANIVIPNSITYIGDYAFAEIYYYESLVLSENLEIIGDYAFAAEHYNNSKITLVDIPESVKVIGNNAFYGIKSLTNVVLHEGLEEIGLQAFAATSLVEINVPNSVSYMGERALAASTLKTISIPFLGASYSLIPADVDFKFTFGSFLVEVESLTINGGCIFASSFERDYDSSNETYYDTLTINNLIIGDDVYYVEEGFDTAGGLILNNYTYEKEVGVYNEFTTYNGVKYLASRTNPYSVAYEVVDKTITEIILHDDTEYLKDDLFSGCSSATYIYIGDNVKYIEKYLFADCVSLVELRLPYLGYSIDSSELEININAKQGLYYFYELFSTSSSSTVFSNLTKLYINGGYFDGLNTRKANVETIEFGNDIILRGYYTGSCFSTTSIQTVILPSNITKINPYLFANSNITSITIPASVEEIGENAFYNCRKLVSVLFEGTNLLNINSNAFSNCINLNDIVLPEGLISIGDFAFYYCTSLTSLVLPESVIEVGEGAVTCCTSLTIGRNVKKFYSLAPTYYTIYYNGSIEDWFNIEFNDISSINYRIDTAFYIYNNDTLEYELVTDIVLPETITVIPKSFFCVFDDLRTIYIPDSVTEIGEYAFYNLEWLYSVTFGDNSQLKKINNSAFFNTRVGSFTLPDSVEYLGNYIFQLPSSIAHYKVNLTISENSNLTTLENYSLANTKIENFYFPKNMTEIPAGAFYSSSVTNIYSNLNQIFDVSEDNLVSCQNWYFNGTFAEYTSLEKYIYPNETYLLDEYGNYYQPSVITIPETVTIIKENMFYRWDQLEEVILHDGITEIGKNAFYIYGSQTSLLKSIDLASLTNLQKIGSKAFCSRDFAEITIPSSVRYLESNVFSSTYIDKLTILTTNLEEKYYDDIISCNELYYAGNLMDWFENIGGLFGSSSLTNLYLLDSNEYKLIKSISIPQQITEIDKGQFSGLSLENIFIHDNVSKMQYLALYGCPNVKLIEIPKGMTIIDTSVIYLSGLEAAILHKGVKEIYDLSFGSSFTLYFTGTKEEFDQIQIDMYYSDQVIYYYSEEAPTDTTYTYWHYDEYGMPILW